MARSFFAGTGNDLVYALTDTRLVRAVTPLVSVTFWSAITGGTQYTDLLLDAVATDHINVTSTGILPQFQGPDTVTQMWADAGAGRVLISAQGSGGGGGAVSSVAGRTGDVLLSSGDLTDFTEATQDAVAALLVSGANVTLSYNDVGNTLQVTASGTDAEVVRDTIGAAIVGTSGIGVTVNDVADTITLTISGVTISQVSGLQTALDAKAALGTSTTTAVANPPSGVYVWPLFVYTDYTVARPTVASNVRLNWVGPAGPAGVPPTNIGTNDTWDLTV